MVANKGSKGTKTNDSWVLHSTEFAVFSMVYAKAPKLQNLYASVRSRPAPPNLLNNLANSENALVATMVANKRIRPHTSTGFTANSAGMV